jgi:hypothetical protein
MFIGVSALGLLIVIAVVLIAKLVRRRREHIESDLLRLYPELTEIVATEKSRDALR